MKFPHGSGSFDGIEVRMEGAQEDIGQEGGLGENEFAGMGGTIIEGESEVKFGCSALVVAQAIAEGLQESLRHEEKRFVAIDRRLELMSDAVVVPGAVELKETMMFPVGNVVESGEFLAEAFGESLAGEAGQIIESLKPPEL